MRGALITFLFILLLGGAGCATAIPLTDARKAVLRTVLAPGFALDSVPKDKTDDFYRVLESYAMRGGPKNLIYFLKFASDTDVLFYWESSTGSPVIATGNGIFRKIDGHWMLLEITSDTK